MKHALVATAAALAAIALSSTASGAVLYLESPPVDPGLVDSTEGVEHIGQSQRSECTGTPGGTCTTGQHARFLNGAITHGFSGVNLAGVTATLESKVASLTSTNARTFRCNVLNGAISCMPGSGTFPANELYEHTCRSYNYGTTTPGGVGNWGCMIQDSSV